MWPLTQFVGVDPTTGPKEAEKPGRRTQNWNQRHFATARIQVEWRWRVQALPPPMVPGPQTCSRGRSRSADPGLTDLAGVAPLPTPPTHSPCGELEEVFLMLMSATQRLRSIF